jgi:RNA polymerase sigma-70 factor (ECF subfamily)
MTDFRHEYGRLVAMLSRRVGVRHLEIVEDAVQHALLAAVESWSRTAVPDNPSAWLYRVAKNRFIDEIRRERRGAEPELQLADPPDAFLPNEIADDELRMLFVCCDEAIPVPSQLALALKTLCGFDVPEIAARLFTSEANIYKRLQRARAELREIGLREPTDLESRLPAVRAIVYLLFTEGHLSSHADEAIRRDLCDEAVRLGTILAEHKTGADPETFALVALMHLHRARMPARQDGSGGLLLLEDQDRSKWDATEIARGLAWLERSATGTTFTRYHAEAGIAAEHCLSPSFAETRWDRIVECYELLERVARSAPLHTLNRAIAVAELRGPAAALALLDAPPTWLSDSYLWSAVLADLHRRAGHAQEAKQYREVALSTAPSAAIRDLLTRRLEALE